MSDVEALARAIRDVVLVGPMGPNSRAVHAGGGMVSLTGSEASDAARALLDSDWLAAHDAATRAEAHEQGSAWMKVRESDLAATRADERALVLGEVQAMTAHENEAVTSLEELIAGVLGEHDSFDDFGYGWHCACGLPFGGDDTWRAHVAAEVAKAVATEVDTLREAIRSLTDTMSHAENEHRDMEIERNMLRVCVKELTDSLEAGDACGAVGCRAMQRLAGLEERLTGAENVAGYWQLRAENAEARFDGTMGRLEELADDYAKDDSEHLDQFGQHHPIAYVAHKHLRAALSTERGA